MSSSATRPTQTRSTREDIPVHCSQGFDAVLPMALEPRFMFDAAGAATGAEAAQDAQAEAEAENANTNNASESSDDAGSDGDDMPAAVGGAAGDDRKDVVIVDPAVQDYQTLIDGLGANVEVIILQQNATVSDIASVLDGMSGVDGLHILSHGGAGALNLGGGALTLDRLAANADALQLIGNALSETGDIVLYGCNIGADGSGHDFINQLAALTGADVSASDDMTGVDALGGDWDMEAASGDIETPVIFANTAMQSFADVLLPGNAPSIGTTSFSFTAVNQLSDGNNTTTVPKALNVGDTGWDVSGTISNPSSKAGILRGVFAGGVGGGNPAPALLASGNIADNALISSLTLGSNDGSEFKLNSLALKSTSGDTDYTITGFKDGDAVTGATRSGTITQSSSVYTTIDVSGNANFGNIDSYTITFATPRITMYVDDISISGKVAANNAPTLGGTPGDVSTSEDIAVGLDLSDYLVADGDGDTITLTLAVDTGTISSSDGNGTTGGVTIATTGTGSMTLAGTAANLNTYLNDTGKITYAPATNATGTATLTVTPHDGTVNGTADTVTINITAVNDAPTATNLTQTIPFTEDASSVALGDIVVTDVDSGDTVTATLTLGNTAAGVLTTGTFGSSASTYNAGTGVWTVTGSVTDVNAALAAVAFTPSANWDQDVSITTRIRDVVDTGPADGTITLDVTAVNDAPVIGGVQNGQSTINAGGGAQSVSLFDDATLSNVDSSDYDGGKITIDQKTGEENGHWGLDGTNATAGGDGLIAAGETIMVGGVAIGTVHASNDGQGGNSLEIVLNANATNGNVQTLLRNLTYDAPSIMGQRIFTLTVNDGDGTANGGVQDTEASFGLKVTSTPPVIDNLSGDSVSVLNGQTVAFDLDGNVTVTDSDSTNFENGLLNISRTADSLSGNFSLTGSGSTGVSSGSSVDNANGTIAAGQNIYVDGVRIASVVTGNGGQGTDDLVLDLNTSNATPELVQAFLRALQYSSTDAGTHTFSLTIRDAAADFAGTSVAATTTINVAAVPVNTVPGAQSVIDGTSKALTGISVAGDGIANITTTISVGAGLGAFSTTASGSASISGGGSHSIQISGTLADVNATLANLQYTPATDASGNQTITVLTSDGTHTDTDTITVTVNDRPDIGNLNGDSVTFTEDGGAVTLDVGNDATITDNNNPSDLNGGSIVVSITGGVGSNDILTAGGAVTFSGTAANSTVMVDGVTIGTLVNAMTGGNDFRVDFNGNATMPRVTTLLRSLAYNNTSDTPTAETRTVTVTLTDNDGGVSAQNSVSLTTVAVNDAPTATVDTANGGTTVVSVTEDTASNFRLSDIDFGDVDGDNLTVTIVVSAGTFSTPASGAGVGSGVTATLVNGTTITLAGSAADINSYLDTASNIQYTGAANVAGTGAATYTVRANDGTSNSQTINGTINIAGVNDAPTIEGLAGDRVSYTKGQTIRLDAGQDALVSDIDSTHFNNGTLTVSIGAGGVAGEDILTLVTSGTTITLSGTQVGSEVRVGGQLVGTLGKAIAAGNDLVINFGPDATPARVQELVRAVGYENSSTSPTVANRTVDFSLSDGTATSAVATTTIVINRPATPPPPPPPSTSTTPADVTPPILLPILGISAGGDTGTPISNAINSNVSGGSNGGSGIAGSVIPTIVTGQLGDSSSLGNSGTPVSAGLASVQAEGSQGASPTFSITPTVSITPVTGGTAILGNGGAVGGGLVSSVGGAVSETGSSGGPGDGAPGNQPQDDPGDLPFGQQPGGSDEPVADGADAGTGDQASLEEGEAEAVFALSGDFSGQLAAFGSLAELEAELLAAALMQHKIPA